MKKISFFLAALCCVATLSARTAASVKVTRGQKAATPEMRAKTVRKAVMQEQEATPFSGDAISFTDYQEVAEGINDYYVTIYTSATDYPAVQFDIYVDPTNIVGTYDTIIGNLDVNYGVYMASEEDYDWLDNATMTITKGAGDTYTFAGTFTTYTDQKEYSYSITSELDVESAYSYDWEPEEITTLNFVPTAFDLDVSYLEGYGIAYLTLSQGDNMVVLEFNSDATSMTQFPAGEYTIDNSGAAGTFTKSVGGDDYSDYGCWVAMDAGEGYYNPYYMVSGTVKVSYSESGKMKIEINATTAHGSTVAITYEEADIPTPTPGEGVTFTYTKDGTQSQTISGISVVLGKGSGTATPTFNTNSNHMRVYANNTITVSGSQIDTIYLTFTKSKNDNEYASMTANCGTLVSGGTSTSTTDQKTDMWTGNASEVVFSFGTGQRAVISIVVKGKGGDTPTPPTPGGNVEMKGFQYIDAYYYDGYYSFDVYTDEDAYYPDLYLEVPAIAKTKLNGTYTIDANSYGGYWTSENDSVEFVSGSFTVKATGATDADGYPIYNLKGSFIGDDDKTYTVNVSLGVWALDWETEEEITLSEGGDTPTPPTPGEDIILVMADYQKISFSDQGVSVSATKGTSQDPIYNEKGADLRVYAGGTLTIDAGTTTMQTITFTISDAGKKRQAEITPSTGTMSYDMTNGIVTWTGNATSVTFTVGDKAKYGTESTKAGQFNFTTITISTHGGGGGGDKPVLPEGVISCMEALAMGNQMTTPEAGKTTKGEQVTIWGYVNFAYEMNTNDQTAFISDDVKDKTNSVQAYKAKVTEAVAVGDYVEVTGTLTKFLKKDGKSIIIEIVDGTMKKINPSTALFDIKKANLQVIKMIHKDQLIIIKNGKKYNAQGMMIRW